MIASWHQAVGMPSSRHFMVNSMSSVRQVAFQPYFFSTSVAITMPVPPNTLESPMVYLARCHTWFTIQKLMAKVPLTQLSLGFFTSRYPWISFSPLQNRLFISFRKSGWTRLSASKMATASYCLSKANSCRNIHSRANPFPTSSWLNRSYTRAPAFRATSAV